MSGSEAKIRLDKALVERGLSTTRSRATQLIEAGYVTVAGEIVKKPSVKVSSATSVTLLVEDPWVSRAAHKLLGALDRLKSIDIEGKVCMDAGASTGGFTQVLLSRGAKKVQAVDVGHGQLAEIIAQDQRVANHEGINLRYITPGQFGNEIELIVCDVSFISLKLLLPPLVAQLQVDGDLLLMIKPQFEVGRARLSRTGVVTSAVQRREAVAGVIEAGLSLGLTLQAVSRSTLVGQDGNVEFFVHFTNGATMNTPEPSRTELLASKLDEVDFNDYQS